MSDIAGKKAPVEVVGTLQWHDLEGGFWSLEFAPEHSELGTSIVLSAFDPPSGAENGSRIRAQIVPRPDVVDFMMAGPRADVISAELAPAADA